MENITKLDQREKQWNVDKLSLAQERMMDFLVPCIKYREFN
jgi:hypothetical protein